MLPPNERKVLILCVGTILIGLLALVAAIGYKSRNQTELSQATPTPKPADAAKLSDQPDFSGADILINYGLSKFQMQDVRNAFTKYAVADGNKITSVEIDADSIIDYPKNPGSNVKMLGFTGKFDGKTKFKGKIDYFDITAARLYITDYQSNKQLFDSGNIDLYNNPQ